MTSRLTQDAKTTYMGTLNRTDNDHKHDCSNDVELKKLALTSDDYIERRMPPYTFDVPYTNISDIDLTKYSNVSVSIHICVS